MKISVSLPDDDVRFLDEYAEAQGFASRSAVLRSAVLVSNDGANAAAARDR